MNRYAYVLVLVTTACGGRPIIAECDIAGVGSVTAEQPINCLAFEQNLNLAVEMLKRANVEGSRTLLRTLMSTSFHVRADETWEFYGKNVDGSSNAFGYIELNPTGTALLHELGHILDYKKNDFSGEHRDWAARGLFDLDAEFTATAQPIVSTQ